MLKHWDDMGLRGLRELGRDLKLWLGLLALLVSLRVLMIAVFWNRVDESTGAHDVSIAILNGLRFDLRSSVVLLLPCFVTSLASAALQRGSVAASCRRSWGTFVLLFTAILGLADLAFVSEYDEQFNHWIFGLVFDDVGAILRTVWTEYPVMPVMIGAALLAWLGPRLLGKWLETPLVPDRVLHRLGRRGRIGAAAVAIVVLVVAGRGSWGSKPVRLRDAAVTGDSFLNELVVDAYSALRYAINAQMELNSSSGLEVFVKDGDVAAAAARFAPTFSGSRHLPDYLRRRSQGALPTPPRHIILVVAEGYDTWPTLAQYSSLGLTPRLEDLAARGVAIDTCVSAGASTTSALVALIAGVPPAGIHVNHRASARQPYPTSLPRSMKELGYHTRFFYGGYLSWQRMGDFARDQGFDEVHGGNEMASWGEGNEWGVDDDVLFDFVQESIGPETPSFDLIMTTSYHSPFDIDVRERGFPLKAIPEDLSHVYDGRFPLEVFGHLWFADLSLGEFVAEAEARLPGALFVVTGDHGSRRFLNRRPSYFERRAVPCVFYGPGLLDSLEVPARSAGSHIDLPATVIELAAPGGHEYHAFGRYLFDASEPVGLGRHTAMGPDYAVDLRDGTVHPVPGGTPPPDGIDTRRLKKRWNDLNGLAWWLVIRGPELPEQGVLASGG